MKKNFTLILIVFIIFSCKTKNEVLERDMVPLLKSIDLKIEKIDSLKNYYIIYANNKTNSYKIISEKEYNLNCRKIVIDSLYSLILNPLTNTRTRNTNSKIPIPINSLDIAQCIRLKDGTEICTEPKFNTLYSTISLIGLCPIKKRE